MTICLICNREAVFHGYCKEHQSIFEQQLVLDALSQLNTGTAMQIQDRVYDLTGLRFTSDCIVAAIRQLHRGGFLVKHAPHVARKAAQWSMV